MKKLILVLAVLLAMSCNNEDVVNKRIRDYVTISFNNSESYKEITTVKNGDVSSRECAAKVVEYNQQDIENAKKAIIEQRTNVSAFVADNKNSLAELASEKISDYNKILSKAEKEIVKAKSKLNDNSIVYRKYEHNCKLGNKDVKFYVYVNNNDSIVGFDRTIEGSYSSTLSNYKDIYLK